MRSPEDLILVDVKMKARVSLDLERIVEDPAWVAIANNLDLNDPEQKKQALFLYLSSYINREQLLDTVFMPSSNGTADIIVFDTEEVNGNSNGNDSNSNGPDSGCGSR